MTNYKLIPVVLSALCLFNSCGRGLEKRQVVGVYYAQLPGVLEKLTLRADGGFSQDVSIEARKNKYHAEGGWKFNAATGRITLRGEFLTVLDAHGFLKTNISPSTNMVCSFEFAHSFGSATIVASENYVYRKQKEQ